MKLRNFKDGKLEAGFVAARHLWRTDDKDEPLLDTFSVSVWKRMPPYRGEDPINDTSNQVTYPNMGWVKIDPASLQTPKAAAEAQENKAQEDAKKKEEVVSESTNEETASEEASAEAQEATKQSSTSSRRRRSTKS